MGLFSSKKKIVVNTTISRVFEDDVIPYSVQTGAIRGIMHSGDIVEYILEEVINTIGVRVQSGLARAKNGDYEWGIPQASTLSAIDAKTQVKAQIETLLNQAITTQYNNFGPMNSLHWGFQYARSTWNYNAVTNELVGLSAAKGAPVYLYDIVPVYTDETAAWVDDSDNLGLLDNWGFSPKKGNTPSRPYQAIYGMGELEGMSPYRVDPASIEDKIEYTYEWRSPIDGKIKQEKVLVQLPTEDPDYGTDWHQVRYTRADGVVDFFTYRQGAGTYPSIDGVFTIKYEDWGTYIPWVYYILQGKDVDKISIKGRDDSRRFAMDLGVDWDQVNDAIHQDGDLDDVEQVMMFFGVEPKTQDQPSLGYLFEYFLQIQQNSVGQRDKAVDLASQLGDYSNATDQGFSIRDKMFRMDFNVSGIKYERRVGKVTEVGRYTGEYKDVTFSAGLRQTTQKAFVYCKQVADSLFEEITVVNPRLNYQIHRKKGFVAKGNDPELLIPIDLAVLDQFGLPDREQILTRGLHLAVNTVTIIKSPWYSSGPFKVLMLVVAVVVTIYSAGAAWGSIVAAASIGIGAVALVVLQMIVTSVAINYAVKMFVKEVGPEIGILAAVAAAAYGVYNMNAQGAFAESFLAASTNLAKESVNAQNALAQDAIADLLGFQEYAQEMYDSLKDTAKELGLDQTNLLNPFDMIREVPLVVWGEAPGAYYDRTIHSGNTGARTFDLTENFVDVKLQLPELDDTIEAF